MRGASEASLSKHEGFRRTPRNPRSWGIGVSIVLDQEPPAFGICFQFVCAAIVNSKDDLTAHGFRATASIILNEQGFKPDAMEAALAHRDGYVIRWAHNRASYWPESVRMLQASAELFDASRAHPG